MQSNTTNKLLGHLQKLKSYFNKGLDLLVSLEKRDTVHFEEIWNKFENMMDELSILIQEAKTFAKDTDAALLSELSQQCQKNLHLHLTLKEKLQEELIYYREQIEKIPLVSNTNSYDRNHSENSSVGVRT